MNWLAAAVTFVNVATVFAVLLGMLRGGLNTYVAALSVLVASVIAVAAFVFTRRTSNQPAVVDSSETSLPRERSSRVWFYLIAFCFGFFAFRGFCWLLFLDGNELKVQSPNNLGDLSLHITYIKKFASGVALWPENPIFYVGHLRYPAGVDIFNGLLLLLGVDLTRGLVAVGLIASAATFYALYRWGGVFCIAGFLFNGGVAGWQVLQTGQWIDYQGVPTIGWKSLALSMFITQRGFLYALPAGLLLLYHWRAKYFPAQSLDRAAADKRGPLPSWLEIALYASMPLFHVHTFMALSIVAAWLFAISDWPARKQLGLMAGSAFLPATFFVWTITDHFNARSLLAWQPGWVQNSEEFAMPFFIFWFVNFGVFIPVALWLLGTCIWRAAQSEEPFRWQDHPGLAFLVPGALIFLFACLVKAAPWEWDNIKLIIWAYLIILPILWTELLARVAFPIRAGICFALFFSGFVSLIGGLVGKENGYDLADRAELDGVAAAVRRLPLDARFATYPTYNHPILLHGRNVVLGYPGHLWTQGLDYLPVNAKLTGLMNGAVGWKETARELRARYLFWGTDEKKYYPGSRRPWEREARLVASGAWGALYDLEAPPIAPAMSPPPR